MNRRLRAAFSAPPPRTRKTMGRNDPRIRRPPVTVAQAMPGPLLLDLIAAVVESGAPPHSALQAVGAALSEVEDLRGEQLLRAAARLGDPRLDDSRLVGGRLAGGRHGGGRFTGRKQADAVRGPGHVLAAMEEALSLAARSGLPPTALVRRAAAEERRRQLSAQLRAIRRLEVLLVIPAGLCLLPAFVLLGIVPLVIDLIRG